MINPGLASTEMDFFSKVKATGKYTSLSGSAFGRFDIIDIRQADVQTQQKIHKAKYKVKMFSGLEFTINPGDWIQATNPRTNGKERFRIISVGDTNFTNDLTMTLLVEKWGSDQTR